MGKKITERKYTRCKQLMDLGIKPLMVSKVEKVSSGTAYSIFKSGSLDEMREKQRESSKKKTMHSTVLVKKDDSMIDFEKQVIDGLNTIIVQLRAIASA